MRKYCVAVVGCGPTNFRFLEHLLVAARTFLPARTQLEILIFEPGKPGQGVHTDSQPASTILNGEAVSPLHTREKSY